MHQKNNMNSLSFMLYFEHFNNISIVVHMYKFICEFLLHATIVHGLVQQSIVEYLINF
jgi:hypothetical protein